MCSLDVAKDISMIHEEIDHEPCSLVARPVRPGVGVNGFDVRVPWRLRSSVKGEAMILLTGTLVVTVLLFIYLLAAMLRPEWF